MQFKRRGDGTSSGGKQIDDMWYVPAFNGGQLDEVAVGGASEPFSITLTAGTIYCYSANVDSWICQGASPTAAKSAGSMFVAKGVERLIDGGQGAKLAVLEDSSGGNATLVEVTV
jgi:hypothetical protein